MSPSSGIISGGNPLVASLAAGAGFGICVNTLSETTALFDLSNLSGVMAPITAAALVLATVFTAALLNKPPDKGTPDASGKVYGRYSLLSYSACDCQVAYTCQYSVAGGSWDEVYVHLPETEMMLADC